MTSKVAGAIGTQQQFTPVPQNTYEKRLASLPSTLNGAAAGSNDGVLLAHALGVLGDTVVNEMASQEKRKETLGISEAERIVSGRTEEDMKKLTAIEMINNYGNFDLADNPYAISTIEKMRGKYFGAQAKEQYTAWRQNQPLAKTSDEEVQRYEKFVQERYGQVLSASSDTTAFRKGFYENDFLNKLDVAGAQLKEKSTEMQTILTGSTKAALGEAVARSGSMKPDELTETVNKIFADTRITGMSIADRTAHGKQLLYDYARQSGDYTRLEQMAQNVVLGVDSNGKPVKLSEVVDLTEFKNLAEQRRTQMFGEDVQKSLEALQAGTKEQANAQYAEWQKNKPEWFNVMLPFRDNVYSYHLKVEQKKKVEVAKAAATEYSKKMSVSVLENQFKAYMAGNTKDVSGNVVAAHFGDLPKFEYTTTDADGNTLTKKFEWTAEHVNAYVDYKLQQIANDPETSSEQKAARTIKLLSWPPAKPYADSVKMQLNNAMDTLSVDKLTTDSSGNPQLSDQLQTAFQWYRTDPEAFYNMFGSEASHKLETLQTLAQASGGDLKQAVSLYAQGRERAKDKEFTRAVDDDIANRLSSTSLSGFMDLDGNISSVNTALASNRSVMARVEALSKYLVYSGMDSKSAIDSALDTAKKTHYIWHDTAIPRAAFNGINSPNRTSVGKQVLDYYLAQFLQDTGVAPQHVTTTFDVDRGVFRLTGGGAYQVYTLNDIAYSGNYILEHQKEQPQGQNITLGEVTDERDQRAAAMDTSIYLTSTPP